MRQWPHAPSRLVKGPGSYMITAGTYQKVHLFDSNIKLDLLTGQLFSVADELGVKLQAWAVFPNHYHLIGVFPCAETELKRFASKLHTLTAIQLNKMDKAEGRRVWYSYWDTALTFEKSYYARLAYVINNPVKHGVTDLATKYPWCSAAWFEALADQVLQQTVNGFATDRVNVPDDF